MHYDSNSTLVQYMKTINHITFKVDEDHKTTIHMGNTNFATIRAKSLTINDLRKKHNKYSYQRSKSEVRRNFPVSRWEQILTRKKIKRAKGVDDDDSDGDDSGDNTDEKDASRTTPLHIPKSTSPLRVKKRRRRTKDRAQRYYINQPCKLKTSPVSSYCL